MSKRQQSHFYKPGMPGADCYIGACGGFFEKQGRVPFSEKGQSGGNIRQIDPDFDGKTLMNASTKVMYRPKTKRTQPTVAQCLRDKEHIAFLRAEAARTRAAGGRVSTVGAVAREVCRRAGIATDEEMPHPSPRNRRRWLDWIARSRSSK